MRCKLCEIAKRKGVIPANHDWSRNYKGSSKGIEPASVVTLFTWLARNFVTPEGNKVYVSTLVGDDDSTYRANAQHSWLDKQAKEIDFV